MTNAGFIIGSYAVTIGGIVGYALWVLRRARQIGRTVPAEDPITSATCSGVVRGSTPTAASSCHMGATASRS